MNQLKVWQKSFKGNLCILASQAHQMGIRVRVISGRRSKAKQAALYAASGQSPYPVAAPGRSQHQYGLAVDLSTTPKTALPTLGSLWMRMGGNWSAADPPHFAFFSDSQWAALLATCGKKAKATSVWYTTPGGTPPTTIYGYPPPISPVPIPLPPEMPPIGRPPVPIGPLVPQVQPVAASMAGPPTGGVPIAGPGQAVVTFAAPGGGVISNLAGPIGPMGAGGTPAFWYLPQSVGNVAVGTPAPLLSHP